MIELNAGPRVFEYIKQNVRQDMAAPTDHNILLDTQKNEYEIRHSDVISLCFMFLTNLTQFDQGKEHLLGKDKLRGAIIDVLFGMFCYFSQNSTFDFIANVLANISSIKDGRVYMMEQAMLPKIAELAETANAHRRMHLIAIICNSVFEYEAYHTNFENVIYAELNPFL